MSSSLSLTHKLGFYEKLLLRQLSEMTLGTLNITLPGGQSIRLGTGDGNISADIDIKSGDFFKRCVLYGDIGFGESYVDGEWETSDISTLIKWFLLNIDNAPSVSGSKRKNFALNLLRFINKWTHFKNQNSLIGSKKNISSHYDLNNDFFALFLDTSMTYSSAYFKDKSMTLGEAQMAKYDRLCRQLQLQPGDHVLEIGSGWGSNAIYMAKHFGCKVTTATISQEQFLYATEQVAKENLQDKITVVLKDYRELKGKFDKIVSIEMLEAVGAGYYNTYFSKCSNLLKKEGILAIQVITCPDSRFESLKNGVDWIQKHIFPGSLLPSIAAINQAVNKTTDFTLVDLKDIGLDYATTLNIWRKEFNRHLTEVKALGFDSFFIRKWNYYLAYCEAAFAMRNINVMQLVYTRPNNTGR